MSSLDYSKLNLSDMNDDEMHYLIEYTDKVANAYVSTANAMYGAANETDQSLSSQLMLLNTVILTASLIALGNGDLFQQITFPHKLLICSTFGLQVISIISGIVNYKTREHYFATAGKTAAKSAKIAVDRKYTNISDMQEKQKRNDARQPDRSKSLTINIQIGSIILSLLIFLVLIGALLFDVPGYSN